MNRYSVVVKYKTFVQSEITLDATDETDAVEVVMNALDTSQVEEFEVMEVTLVGEASQFAPSTETAQ